MTDPLSNARSSRGRPSQVSTGQIVTAALRLLQDSGVAGLTMAKLARQMDAGVMTLYHYFPSKTALLEAVADAVFARFVTPKVSEDWEDGVRQWVKAVHVFFAENPIALDLINLRSHISPAWLRVSLPMLHILAKAGFSDQTLALTSRWLVSTVMGIVTTRRMSYDSDHPTLPKPTSLSDEEQLLVASINAHYDSVAEEDLLDLVSSNLVRGLRTLHAKI